MAYHYDQRRSGTASADGWAVVTLMVLAFLLLAWLVSVVLEGRSGSTDGLLSGSGDRVEQLLNSPQRSRMRP